MADLALEGRVVEAHPVAEPDGSIWTEYRVAVDQTLFGEALAERTIKLPGGTLPNGLVMVVPGVPRLSIGEEALLLLAGETTQAGARMIPVGLAQGKLTLVRGTNGRRLAVRDLAGIHAASETVHGEEASHDVHDYAELKARLTAAFATRQETAR